MGWSLVELDDIGRHWKIIELNDIDIEWHCKMINYMTMNDKFQFWIYIMYAIIHDWVAGETILELASGTSQVWKTFTSLNKAELWT